MNLPRLSDNNINQTKSNVIKSPIMRQLSNNDEIKKNINSKATKKEETKT